MDGRTEFFERAGDQVIVASRHTTCRNEDIRIPVDQALFKLIRLIGRMVTRMVRQSNFTQCCH
ncbi:hypothetical protein NX02_02020 [Sphingomonas sanxanigenens DSM 19645 = NX02]|uniref:Uncharacterized protein n=1 Tax=Sphingomonas sanxanigenens DSM 19645 = NX02 TaxID=1123269 RepID=W0A917_9SPHN|nr:hypothetical protein NX02_02020 [Sphingomonas sanxanigenens DSM 19645 = NX02]